MKSGGAWQGRASEPFRRNATRPLRDPRRLRFPENPIWLIDWELTLFRRFSPALVVTALFTSVLAVFRS
jgi:hypothetical protein